MLEKSESSKAREMHAKALLGDRAWRLTNLYKIKDKSGYVVNFEPNWAQIKLMKPHYLNIILKARQLGVTTFFSILFLDTCLFNDNVNAAIIADNKPTAKEIFIDKVKFAYDNLPDWVRQLTPAYRDNVNELRFSNGSVFRVGTGLRGGTLQLLHITEFAKICIENPGKASEIMSGALNTLQSGQFACIESTARGREGFFYDMCKQAISLQDTGKEISQLDWKFWFFPWHKHPDYFLQDPNIVITKEMEKYFMSLDEKGITLTDSQKAWYIKKAETQGEYMKREYPSTPEEAFETANEGYYFAALMGKAREGKRICKIPADDYVYKFAAWDIGISDSTAIWVFQVIGKEVHFLDYYTNSGEALPHYIKWCRDRKYNIEKHFMPFDAGAREKSTGKTYADFAREGGLKVELVPKTESELYDIELCRAFFPKIWFDETNCSEGIKSIENYRKEWNEKLGCFRERPLHDWASHGTKAFMYAIKSIDKMTGSRGLTAEEWKNVRAKYI